MPIYTAGLDRSETPNPKKRKTGREFYTVCIAAFESPVEELEAILASVRYECGRSARAEFRGHDDPEAVQLKVLHAVAHLEPMVGVALYEKVSAQQLEQEQFILQPTELQFNASLTLLEKFFARYQIIRLWCDEDIKGKEKQEEFETAAERLHRAAYPNTRMKVRHKPSHQSASIQMADVFAYGLSRLARGLVENAELRQVLKAIRDDPRNVIEGALLIGEQKEGGDLRTYPRRG